MLALVMLFGALSLTITAQPDDTLYSANWAVSYPWIYESINGNSSIINSSLFPQELILKKVADGWYYATNSDWDANYDSLRYIKESSLTNIALLQNTTTAQIGAFTVSVDGAIPSNVSLKASVISEEDVDPGIFERQDVNMVKFLACYDLSLSQNGTEWQPTKGNPVTVTMNAAALGLYTGQEVYVIHMHENADDSKEYETIGPLFVANGLFSFEANSFSPFAIYQGNGAIALKDTNTTIYAEPGSVIALGGYVTIPVVGSQLVNAKYTSGEDKDGISHGEVDASAVCGEGKDAKTMSIEISGDAVVGSTTTYVVTCKYGRIDETYNVTVIVGSRAKVTEIALQTYPLMIGIHKPSDDGTFPSEPSDTSYDNTNYFFLQDVGTVGDQVDDTISTNAIDYSNKASDYLDSVAMGNTFGWMYDVEGNAIGGVIDATGYYTKSCFKENTVSWSEIAQVIAKYNDSIITAASLNPATVTPEQITERINDANDTSLDNLIFVRYRQEDTTQQSGFQEYAIALTGAEGKTIDSYGTMGVSNHALVHYSQFELIPYVIKLMPAKIESGGWFNTSNGSVWHVDIAVVRGDSYTISYDLNLGKDIVTTTDISLPNAKTFVENPSDDDKALTYTFVANTTDTNGNLILGDDPDPLTITVYAAEDANSKLNPVTAIFKGWFASNTCSDYSKLYGPSAANKSITIEQTTKLYAIWELQGSLALKSTSFSVTKQVHLAAGSPAGSQKPSVNGADFHTFDFTVTIPYVHNLTGEDAAVAVNNKLGEMYFVASKYVGGVMTEIPTASANISDYITLAELCDDGSRLSFIKDVDEQDDRVVLTFELSDGEYINFLNVPYFSGTNEAKYNYYLVTEAAIPTDLQDKYSAGTTEQTLKLNELADARATFINYYTPPVAGLQISAQSGEPGEWIVCEVTATYSGFEPLQLAVQVGGPSVTVVGLLCGNEYVYTVTELNTNTTVENIVLIEGQVTAASLTTTRKPKWFFGFGMIKQTANGQN